MQPRSRIVVLALSPDLSIQLGPAHSHTPMHLLSCRQEAHLARCPQCMLLVYRPPGPRANNTLGADLIGGSRQL